MSKDDNHRHSSANRRAILQSVGIAGISMTGLVGTGTATEPQRSVKIVDGNEKRRVINSIISSNEFIKLRSSIPTGAHPEPQSGQVFDVIESDGEEYRVATIGISNKKTDSHFFLTWSDISDPSIPNYTITNYDATEHIQTRLFIENGGVVEEQESWDDVYENQFGGSDETVSISQTWDPDDCYSYLTEECTDVNWSCLASIAVHYASCSYALLVGSLMGVLICIAGVGISLWQAADNEGCSLCDSTSVREVTLCGTPSP